MRQTFKDGMGRIFQRPKTHTEYTLDDRCGMVRVNNVTHEVDKSIGLRHSIYLGTEVYVSKGRLIDVKTGKVLTTFTRARKVNVSET
jgi:hypothetical protein